MGGGPACAVAKAAVCTSGQWFCPSSQAACWVPVRHVRPTQQPRRPLSSCQTLLPLTPTPLALAITEDVTPTPMAPPGPWPLPPCSCRSGSSPRRSKCRLSAVPVPVPVPGWEHAHGGLAGLATPVNCKHGSLFLQFLQNGVSQGRGSWGQMPQGSPERGPQS